MWRFETDSTLGDALSGQLGRFPDCLEDMFLSSRRCDSGSERAKQAPLTFAFRVFLLSCCRYDI